MKTIQEIKAFAETKESSGALLLTGKWGCGKTFLIGSLAEQLDKAQYLIVVVSLFGIKSVDALPNLIKQKIVFSRYEVDDKHLKKGTQLWQAVANTANKLQDHIEAAKLASAVMSVNPLDFISIKNTDKNGRKLILVFDDFERCTISKRELLGVINDYVETKQIKTIVVADEEQIDETDYFLYKEKVISQTIHYTPDSSKVIRNIITKYSETQVGYQQFLLSQESLIRLLFQESESENLRTLRAVFIGFERIYTCISQINQEIDISICGLLLYSYGALLYEHKTGKHAKNGQGIAKLESKVISKYSRFNEQGSHLFSFHHWIIDGELNEIELKQEYIQRYCLSSFGADQKLLTWSLWDCDDSIISSGFNILLPQAYEGSLPCNAVMKLILIIGLLRKYDILPPCTVDYEKIKAGLQKRCELIKCGDVDEPAIPEPLLEENTTFLSEIELAIWKLANNIGSDYSVYWRNRREFLRDIVNCTADNLRDLQHRYYISFDSDMKNSFWLRYYNSENKIKRLMAMMLNEMHFKDYLRDEETLHSVTLDSLIGLRDSVVMYSESGPDSITRIINKEFEEILTRKIQKIEEHLSPIE